MYAKDVDIASLISSRICHDLVSPLGAISNGLELLELSGIAKTPELALLNDSIDSANSRVQFFRIAYGSAPDDLMLNPDVVQQTLAGYYVDKRVKAKWNYPHPVRRIDGKLLFLLVQCMETALPYGGNIQIRHPGGGWLLEASGRIVLTNPLWNVFKDGLNGDPVRSSEVQFELARALAEQKQMTVEIAATDDDLRIMVS